MYDFKVVNVYNIPFGTFKSFNVLWMMMLMIICCVVLVNYTILSQGTAVLEEMMMMMFEGDTLNRNWLSRIFYSSEEF